MKENLVTVATYARQNNKSLAWAYKQVTLNKVATKKIDTVLFIINGKKSK